MTTIEALNAIARLILGFVFLSAGSLKLILEGPEMIKEWGRIADRPAFNLRVLAVVEILAGSLLVASMMFRMPQWIAAAGAALVIVIMAGAMFEYGRRREFRNVFLNLVLASVAAFVLWTPSV